ncbi:MAG: DNA polymerase III subunit beta [Actinobacteria bacterium]|nr:DNA polymerase III subunit beta [Actinomycetota bacterium]
MIVSCDKEKLNNLIQTALRGVSSRATMPILSGIHISAGDNKLIVSGTDLEMSIKTEDEAEISEGGSTVVSGKLMGDITKSLPAGEVILRSSDKFLTVKTANGEYKVKEMMPEDYPQIPVWEGKPTITVNGSSFLTSIQQTSRASSSDEKRPVLTGTLFEKDLNKSVLKLVSTDSYRLSYRELEVEGSLSDWEECIVPAKTLNEVARLAGTIDADVEMQIRDRQIIFKIKDLIISSRLIEGQFPSYKQLLPKGEKTSIKLDKAEVVAVLKRALVFGSNLRFGVFKDHIQISTETPEVGESKEEITAEVEGEEMEIGFNGNYLMDGMTALSSEKSEIKLDDPQKPVLVKSMDSDGFQYILMPVRLK